MLAPAHSHPTLAPLWPSRGDRHGLGFLNFWDAFGVSPMIEYTFAL
jgi:hypothetical protein